MIELIKIKNYALIEDAEIELGPALNIISGETGAGKSLFIGALSLILGEKAHSHYIGKNDKEASVEAIVRVDKTLSRKLKKFEIDHKESIIIKRVIGERNRCYIDGGLISQAQLKEITSGLLDICSQHENQSLLEESVQREVLDQSVDPKIIENVKLKYQQMKSLQEEINNLKSNQKSGSNRKDFIEFQLEEIKSLKISEADEKNQETLQIMKNSAKISDLEKSIKDSISSSQGIKALSKEVFYTLTELDQLLDRKFAQEYKQKMEDFHQFLDKIPRTALFFDEEKMNELMSREEELAKLKRKHGSIHQILEIQSSLEKELDLIENFDEILKEKSEQLLKIEKDFKKAAKELSSLRIEVAKKIEKMIEKNLHSLNMPWAQFKIHLTTKEPSLHGTDQVQFMIAPNRGEELAELAEIASGGELSRVILAIRAISADSKMCYLFDEVDAGIGGDTAFMVGQKLQEIGSKKQVICITHLPQVAVYGDTNFNIVKVQSKDKTVSKINSLNQAELIVEISRMLGGSLAGESARANALTLIKKAKQK